MLKTIITEDQIRNHPNWLSSINLKESNLTAHILYNGNPLQLFVFWNGELLFNEKQYRPPASFDFCSLETMIDMLEWFIERNEDEKYNERQKKWFNSEDCEELKHKIFDYVEDCDGRNDALIYFNGAYDHC